MDMILTAVGWLIAFSVARFLLAFGVLTVIVVGLIAIAGIRAFFQKVLG